MGRTASLGNSNLEEPPGEFKNVLLLLLISSYRVAQKKSKLYSNIQKYINKSTFKTELIIIIISIYFGDSLQIFKEPMHNSGQHQILYL